MNLPLTARQLAQDKRLALCLYHISDQFQIGICAEVRTVENGELLSEPIVIRDNPKADLDKTCAFLLEKVRLLRK